MKLEKEDKNANQAYFSKYQHVSDVIGSWGPLQKKVFIMLSIVYMAGPFNNMGIIFYSTKSQFWCSDSNPSERLSSESQCKNQFLNESCHAWTFNDTRKTIINEWTMVCDQTWLISFTLSAYQIGYMVSGPLFGLISDAYGRKRALIISIVLEVFATFFSVFSVTALQFIAARFFMGIAGYARYLSSLLLLAECVGPKIRAKTIAGYDIYYFIIKGLSIAVAYYLKSFRTFHLVVGLVEITFFFWIHKIPESPIWQLINDEFEPAKETILKYSKKHGESSSQVMMKLEALYTFLSSSRNDQLHTKKPNIFEVFHHWILIKNLLILSYIWFIAAYINYGVTFALRDLTGSIYINSLILCLADILSTGLLWIYVEKIRRKTILSICQLATGIIFLCMIRFLGSKEHLLVQTVFIMIGKFFAGVIFSMVYVYTPEIFPTSFRQFGVGLCAVISRVASISSAFIPELVKVTNIETIFLIFGIMALIGGAFTFLLFETKGKEMPNTVEEMIELRK